MPTSPLSSTNFHTSAQRRQIVELIDIMSPREVPLLKLIGIDGEPGRNPKFEWLEDTLLAESSTITDNPLSNSATTVNVATGTGVNFQPKMLVKIDNEYLYVTAVTGDALTVVRGIENSGTGTSHVQGSTIEIIGLANAENTDAPRKGTTDLVIPYNYFQAFDTSYQISYIAANTDVHGVPEGDEERELEKAFQEVTIKLENTCFKGYRLANEGVTGVPRLMGGLTFFLSSAYSSQHYEADAGGAQLSEKMLNDMLQDRYHAVGAQNMGKTIVCGAWQKRRINDLFAPYVRMERSETTGGVVVDTLDTDWGPIDVVMSLRCPRDRVFLVNLDFLSIHPYEDLAFFDEEKASTGAFRVREIYGVYTMAVRNSKAMGVIKNLATN